MTVGEAAVTHIPYSLSLSPSHVVTCDANGMFDLLVVDGIVMSSHNSNSIRLICVSNFLFDFICRYGDDIFIFFSLASSCIAGLFIRKGGMMVMMMRIIEHASSSYNSSQITQQVHLVLLPLASRISRHFGDIVDQFARELCNLQN